MATYVEGEAVETDSSDDEQYVFNLSYMKIGNDSVHESPNIVVDNTKDLILKGTVIDGVTEVQDLINTPVATELTEDFSPTSSVASVGESQIYLPEHNMLRRKLNELSTSFVRNYVQDRIAPISKKMIDTDNSLINTQLTLQDASTSMKNFSERSSKLSAKFKNLMVDDSDFLPKINKLP